MTEDALSRLVAFLAVVASTAGDLAAQVSAPRDSVFPVRMISDLRYGPPRDDSGSQRILDLYEPAGPAAPAPRPVFLAIHGGGLRHGDKRTDNIVEWCRGLASRGHACAAMNYRLRVRQPDGSWIPSPATALQDAVSDAALALEWLGREASRLQLDTGRVAVGGSSAGATIALHLGYNAPLTSRRITAVVSWSGAFYAPMELIGPNEPPLFVIHGVADTLVSVDAARAMVARARAIGLAYSVVICRDLGHTVPLDRRPGGRSLYSHLAAFLHQHLGIVRISETAVPHQETGSRWDRVAQTDTLAVDCPR